MLESTWLTQWLLFGGSWRRRISVAVHLLFQIGLGRHLLLCPCKSQLAKVLQRKRNWFNWCLLWSTYSKKLEMTALWETTKCRTTSVNWRLGLTTVADTMVVAIRKRMFVSMSIQVTPAFCPPPTTRWRWQSHVKSILQVDNYSSKQSRSNHLRIPLWIANC